MKPTERSHTGGGFGQPPIKKQTMPDVEDKSVRGPKEQKDEEAKPASDTHNSDTA